LCGRGVDWQWEDQDGGNGRRGKVTEVQVQFIGGFAHLLAVFRIRFHLIRIWILHCRLNSDPDPDLIRIKGLIKGFDDQKLEKIYCWKKLKKIWSKKTAIYPSLGLHKGFPSYRRSFQPLKENIQHFKT
jgi:hypothetical protein